MSESYPQQVSALAARTMADRGPQLAVQKIYTDGLLALLAEIERSQTPDPVTGKNVVYAYFSYDDQMWIDGIILASRELASLETDNSLDAGKVQFLEHTNDPGLG